MTMALGLLAGSLFLLYSIYFIRIIKGKPQSFELELLRSLAGWMVKSGLRSKGQLWFMYFLSLLIELTYFILVFLLVSNPFMQYFSALMAGFEAWHLLWLGLSLRQFFAGLTRISQMFNWRMERISAILFFTHTMLVLIILYIL